MEQFKIEPVSIDSMVGGRIKGQLDRAITEAISDIDNRPEVRKDRTITLTLTFSPPAANDPQGVIGFTGKVAKKTPPEAGFRGTAIMRDGGAVVHVFPDENPAQMDFFEEEPANILPIAGSK